MLTYHSFSDLQSYITGFVSWFSWITLAASNAGAVSYCCFALIYYAYPSFEAKEWHSFLFFEATAILALLLNLFGKKLFAFFYSLTCKFSLTCGMSTPGCDRHHNIIQ